MGAAAESPKTSTSPRPTPSSEPSEPSRPRTPQATPVPDSPRATGPRLDTDVVSLRMPRGWTLDSDDGYYHAASDRSSRSKVTLYTDEFEDGQPSPSLLSMVDGGLRYARANVSDEAKQAPNVRIDGELAVHITAKHDDTGDWYDEYDSLRDRANDRVLVTLIIEVDGTSKERDRVVNSILATWEWQDA